MKTALFLFLIPILFFNLKLAYTTECSGSLSFEGKLAGLNWVSYAPTSFNPDVGLYPDEEVIREDLTLLLAEGFNGVVTYGSENTLRLIPCIANDLGFQGVIMGIWDPLSDVEKGNALSAADCVDGYGVGNEGLIGAGGDRYDRQQLTEAIDQMKLSTGKPAATSEQIDDYISDPTLLDIGDWVFPIVHPYWHGVASPIPAVDWTKAKYQELLLLMAAEGVQKPVLIKEVGLPSGGCEDCSEDNQAEYYRCLYDYKVCEGLPFSFFEAYDQPWKWWAPVEPHWGLYLPDRSPKEVIRKIALAPWCSQPPVPGDANYDGAVDVLDVITILRISIGQDMVPCILCAVDMNADEQVNLLDITLALRKAIGLDGFSLR